MKNVTVFKTCLKILLSVTLTHSSSRDDEQTELRIIKIWGISPFCVLRGVGSGGKGKSDDFKSR